MPALRRGRIALILMSLTSVAGDGHAYVRTCDLAGAPVRWQKPRIAIALSSRFSPQNISEAEVRQALSAAMDFWNGTANDCSDFRFELSAATVDADAVRDGRNVVVFRERAWCGSNREGQACHPAGMQALTSVRLKKRQAHEAQERVIEEADIEINGAEFRWRRNAAALDPGALDQRDLQSTFVHELGHVLGLEDACQVVTNDQENLRDHHGLPVRRCADLAEAKFPAMYPMFSSIDSLAPDEDQAICRIYPKVATGNRISTFSPVALVVLSAGIFMLRRRSAAKAKSLGRS